MLHELPHDDVVVLLRASAYRFSESTRVSFADTFLEFDTWRVAASDNLFFSSSPSTLLDARANLGSNSCARHLRSVAPIGYSLTRTGKRSAPNLPSELALPSVFLIPPLDAFQ